METSTHELGQSTFRTWSVSIGIGTREGRTHATAHLHTDGEGDLTGNGVAYLSPSDPRPPIGAELAVGRALFDLAHLLVQNAASDVAESLRACPGYEHAR